MTERIEETEQKIIANAIEADIWDIAHATQFELTADMIRRFTKCVIDTIHADGDGGMFEYFAAKEFGRTYRTAADDLDDIDMVTVIIADAIDMMAVEDDDPANPSMDFMDMMEVRA